MRIVVVGCSRGTGRLVVEQGRDRGHDMVGVSRSVVDILGVTMVAGDARSPGVVEAAVGGGADALVLAFGGTRGKRHQRTEVTAAVLKALPSGSVGRVVVHSSVGVGDSARYLPGPLRFVTRLVLGRALADHAKQEELVRSSGIPWTIVRPGQLTNGPSTGNVAALEAPAPFRALISRAEVAAFILDCLEDPATMGRAFVLGGRVD